MIQVALAFPIAVIESANPLEVNLAPPAAGRTGGSPQDTRPVRCARLKVQGGSGVRVC